MTECNRKNRLLGKSIRKIRMRRNMTQRELANAAGLGESAFRSYELGERSPKQNTLERIAKALDVAPACFDTYGIEHYDELMHARWLHYRDLKSRCPTCERPAHIAKRDGTFYFVDDEYNPFVRHAPVKTTEAVFRFFTNGYRREHGTEPKVTGNRKLSESDILSGMGAVSVKIDS